MYLLKISGCPLVQGKSESATRWVEGKELNKIVYHKPKEGAHETGNYSCNCMVDLKIGDKIHLITLESNKIDFENDYNKGVIKSKLECTVNLPDMPEEELKALMNYFGVTEVIQSDV